MIISVRIRSIVLARIHGSNKYPLHFRGLPQHSLFLAPTPCLSRDNRRALLHVVPQGFRLMEAPVDGGSV